MNHPLRPNPFFHLPLAVCLAALTIIGALSPRAQAQSTSFTYQGRLTSSGAPETGLYNFEFSLRDSATGGSQVGTTIFDSIFVEAGVFSVELDFGPIAYSSQDLFLQINVDGATLTPNQPINPTPFAIDDEVGGGGGSSVWTSSGGGVGVYYSGRVGVSTSFTQGYPLHVGPLSGSSTATIALGGGDSFNGPARLSYETPASGSEGTIRLYQRIASADSGEGITIKRNRVGVNVTSPAGNLHVFGAPSSTLALGGNPGNSGPAFISFTPNAVSPSEGLIKIQQHTPHDHFGISIRGNQVGINQENPTEALDVFGNIKCVTAIITSDRDKKAGFEPVDPREVLDKVTAMPITKWHYKIDKDTPHIGPVAQDFHEAFGLGVDDKHIATVDADGIALAAIQGLSQVVEEKDEKIEALEERLAALEELLNSSGQ